MQGLGPTTVRPLFRSTLVSVADSVCAADHRGCDVDRDDGCRLLFTRSGAARLRAGCDRGAASVIDPTRPVVLPADLRCALDHVAVSAHRCTTFVFSRNALDAELAHDMPLAGEANAHVLLRYHRLRYALVERAARAERAARDIAALAIDEEAMHLLRAVIASRGSAAPATGAGAATARARRRRRELVDAAKAMLAANPGDAHRLEHLADALAVSPSHLAHVFRDEAGLPLHQYLLQLRMAIALDHLSAGAPDLSRLAVDLGFATHSHFSAAFRRWFRLAPREARMLLRSRAALPS